MNEQGLEQLRELSRNAIPRMHQMWEETKGDMMTSKGVRALRSLRSRGGFDDEADKTTGNRRENAQATAHTGTAHTATDDRMLEEGRGFDGDFFLP